MPSLSTSLCIVSGPGALPLLRNLTGGFGRQHRPRSRAHFRHQICSYLGPQEDKNTCDDPL